LEKIAPGNFFETLHECRRLRAPDEKRGFRRLPRRR
jgi:hypothetical protein